jgi:hypothetical protein
VTKKLSPAMQKVIDLMRDGYELGRSTGYMSSCWLQKGGLGRGGHCVSVNENTFHALYDRGLLKRVSRELESPTRYELVSK